MKTELREYPYNRLGEPEIDDLLDRVEEALGFRLFIWQRQYIWTGEDCWIGGRWTGKTTALILRSLLIFTEDDEPLDMIRPITKRGQLFKEEMKAINQKLDEFGIPTREAWYNEDYKALVEKRKTFEIPLHINPLDVNELAEKINKTIDNMILYRLHAYGINRDNLVSQLDRIHIFNIYSEPNSEEKAAVKKRFLIDGKYRFTVCQGGSFSRDGLYHYYSVWIEKEKNV